MSSEVETSRGITSRQCNGAPRLRFASLGMTEKVFARLDVYCEACAYSAAMNMAIDEALLESAVVPSIRFYNWQSPALSFGYFGRFADVARYCTDRDLVRRWTGGGIVFHGEDLTYSIVIPVDEPAFGESSMSIYERIHRALADALSEIGEAAELSTVAAVYDRREQKKGNLHSPKAISLEPAVADRRYNNCFANPVRADVIVDGQKVAGAAQRRTRRGLLQQGSIQGVDFGNRLAERFARALSKNCRDRKIGDHVLQRGRELVQQKYGTETWLQKR